MMYRWCTTYDSYECTYLGIFFWRKYLCVVHVFIKIKIRETTPSNHHVSTAEVWLHRKAISHIYPINSNCTYYLTTFAYHWYRLISWVQVKRELPEQLPRKPFDICLG